jgi:hypothetical protein
MGQRQPSKQAHFQKEWRLIRLNAAKTFNKIDILETLDLKA